MHRDPDETADQTLPPTRRAPSSGTDLPATSGGQSRTNAPPPRFAPGQLIAGRYRVVAFLGRGGMGEVYRADDLELAQSVAVKLLPERIAQDPTLADRVRQEVRLARQITHRNVCRIHDIAHLPPAADNPDGDPTGGDLFITMEYVDGEDLSTLLRRIGRLPQDKAIDVARQLCAALAAAHDEGVIHRDLKPANVMLDGRGNVRLTDFGIAAVVDEIGEHEAATGTPAYMAPEQYTGEGVSQRSDIYALGLVIYELLTGKPAWRADSLAELRTLRGSVTAPPALTATGRADIDPALAALVDRCLDTNPDNRPASALAVAAALPGADPLAAALAAGETPSPELIAASGGRGVLAPKIAATIVAVNALLIAAAVILSSGTTLLTLIPPPPAPELMRETAIGAIEALGYDAAGAEGDPLPIRDGWTTSNFAINETQKAIRAGALADWSGLGEHFSSPIRYWLRIEPSGFRTTNPSGVVTQADPPRTTPGSTYIQLDANRNLKSFFRKAPTRINTASVAEPDWAAAFALAGLDFASFTPIESRRQAGTDADTRRGWTGSYPEDGSGLEAAGINVYAAAFNGQLCEFDIVGDEFVADAGEAAGGEQDVPDGTADEPAAAPAGSSERGEHTAGVTASADSAPDEPDPDGTAPVEDASVGTGADETATGDPSISEAGADDTPARELAAGPAQERASESGSKTALIIQSAAQYIILVTITLIAAILAYRNIRTKRSDLRRAFRLGVTVFALTTITAVLSADTFSSGLALIFGPFPIYSLGLGLCVITVVLYIAVEPLARSKWPNSLVSWTRLFSGGFRDPMIGRDVLIGVTAGTGLIAVTALAQFLAPRLTDVIGADAYPPSTGGLIQVLEGPKAMVAQITAQVAGSFLNSAAIAVLILLTMVVLGWVRIRRRWPAIIIVAVLSMLQTLNAPNLSPADRVALMFGNLLVIALLDRAGLLATAVAIGSASILTFFITAAPYDQWWAASGLIPGLTVAALLAYAYRTATAGRSLFDA